MMLVTVPFKVRLVFVTNAMLVLHLMIKVNHHVLLQLLSIVTQSIKIINFVQFAQKDTISKLMDLVPCLIISQDVRGMTLRQLVPNVKTNSTLVKIEINVFPMRLNFIDVRTLLDKPKPSALNVYQTSNWSMEYVLNLHHYLQTHPSMILRDALFSLEEIPFFAKFVNLDSL